MSNTREDGDLRKGKEYCLWVEGGREEGKDGGREGERKGRMEGGREGGSEE